MSTTDLTARIEILIDENGVLHLLTAIEIAYAERAAILRHERGDSLTVRELAKISKIVGIAAREVQAAQIFN